MKKLMAAAILSTALTGLIARAADDAPATQPTTVTATNGLAINGVTIRSDGNEINADRLVYSLVNAAKTEKAAWMGVATSHPPLALFKQLKIKSGLVVDDVKSGSPADLAGLKPQDLIEKIDDQILINPSQLEGLVRLHKPGDSVTLTILHEGSQSTLTAKLAEHDVLVMNDEGSGILNFQSGSGNAGMSQSFIPGSNMRIDMQRSGTGNLIVTPDGAAHVEVRTNVQNGGQIGQASSFESQFSDGKGQLTVVRRNKQKILTIKDNQGKTLFEGPIDTPEQQQAIPKDLLPRFQEMQKMAILTDDSPKP